jgi:hypothetical protein
MFFLRGRKVNTKERGEENQSTNPVKKELRNIKIELEDGDKFILYFVRSK